MKIINLIGAPGSGKSTLRARIFADMKIAGYNVEEITEYAKDAVWEERQNLFSDQLYIFAKQHRRLLRLQGKVDYVITDSPLIMNIAYQSKELSYYPLLAELTSEIFNSYENINFFLHRTHEYQQIGRNQDEAQSQELSEEIKSILNKFNCSYIDVNSNEVNFEFIKKYL
jgi:nicotinamide riboside kinase